uniref:Uncharacterized protein n=1 Tax=Anguilla anguilla TaxID=7936 RepID=A0A0E9V117_ANGAN
MCELNTCSLSNMLHVRNCWGAENRFFY